MQATLKVFLGLAFMALLIGASAAPLGYLIQDFKCGYDGQMVSGFKNGKPICTTPAGFIMPNLNCPKGWQPQVLVGIHDGQPVCKILRVYGDQPITAVVNSEDDEIDVWLHYTPPTTN